MRKRILIPTGFLVVIIGLVLLAVYQNQQDSQTKPLPTPAPIVQEAEANASSSAALNLLTATVTVPEASGSPKLILKNGQGTYDKNNYLAYISIIPTVYEEQQTAQGKDIFGAYSVNYGGSGQFVYLVLFRESWEAVSESSRVSLGDRVVIKSVVVNPIPTEQTSYEVVVSYLEHGPSQGMAEVPDVLVTKTFLVNNHVFVPSN